MARRTLLATGAVGLLLLSACTRPEDARPATSGDPIAAVDTVDDADDADDVTDATDTGDETSDASATTGMSTSTTAGTTTTTTTTTSVAGETAEPPATTAAASTATTTTTTTPAPDEPSDLTLIFDGILPFRFGDRDVDVVPALTTVLGAPTLDELSEYPDTDQGMFFDSTGEQSFVAHFGRTVCFADGLCVQFGAGAPETLIFTGWSLGGQSDLATEDGIVIGSTLADFVDVIEYDPAMSCYQVAYGTASGIDVTLLSEDGVFAAPNADGDGLDVFDPDPTMVTVTELRAGQLPVFVFADC